MYCYVFQRVTSTLNLFNPIKLSHGYGFLLSKASSQSHTMDASHLIVKWWSWGCLQSTQKSKTHLSGEMFKKKLQLKRTDANKKHLAEDVSQGQHSWKNSTASPPISPSMYQRNLTKSHIWMSFMNDQSLYYYSTSPQRPQILGAYTSPQCISIHLLSKIL